MICVQVLAAGRTAQASLPAWMIRFASGWFVLAVWTDVSVVALGRLHLLDALGVLLLVGVVLQAVLAAGTHLLPMALGRGPGPRERIRATLDFAPGPRVAMFNVGVLLVTAAAAAGTSAAPFGARLGWALVAVVVLGQLGVAAISRPVPRRTPAA